MSAFRVRPINLSVLTPNLTREEPPFWTILSAEKCHLGIMHFANLLENQESMKHRNEAPVCESCLFSIMNAQFNFNSKALVEIVDSNSLNSHKSLHRPMKSQCRSQNLLHSKLSFHGI